MIPTSAHNGKFLSLEAGRGIAALLVVLCHVANGIANNGTQSVPFYITMFAAGSSGVDFFFVLSGFIILFVHHDDIDRPSRLPNYLISRFIRVVPIYWIALVAIIVIRMWLFVTYLPPSVPDIVWSMLMQPTGHDGFYLPIAWTLQYEVVFYGLFATLLLSKRVGMTIFALWIVWIAVANIAGTGNLTPVTGLHNLEFFGGMGAACVLRNHRLPMPRVILAAGLSLFVIALLMEASKPIVADSNWSLYGIASVLIVLGAVETERQSRLSIPERLRILGSASYSIYLFHYCALQALASSNDRVAAPVAAVTSVPVSAASQELSWLSPVACFVFYSGLAVGFGVMMSQRVEFPLIRIMRSVMSHRKNAAAAAFLTTTPR